MSPSHFEEVEGKKAGGPSMMTMLMNSEESLAYLKEGAGGGTTPTNSADAAAGVQDEESRILVPESFRYAPA